jgi:hypothetical protein
VLVNVEDDPTFSPLSLHRVHFQLGSVPHIATY